MNDSSVEQLMQCPAWRRAFALQQETVQRFHQDCRDILSPGCVLLPLDTEQLSPQRNLFSTLFIMAVEASGVRQEMLPFYAMLIQCLRAQVTGCDNILDDEYKSVVPFALPGSGIRFRSVLTVMTADAVLARSLLTAVSNGRMDEQRARICQSAALAVLIPSGIEEHEEESGSGEAVPGVEKMLRQVHYRKTGLLFEAPVRVAEQMGDTTPGRAGLIAAALADFGVACQVIDDLQDVADDLSLDRYNLVVAEAYHGESRQEKQVVEDWRNQPGNFAEAKIAAERLPLARERSLAHAYRYFQQAQDALCSVLPEFGPDQVLALTRLVMSSIMSERSEVSAGSVR